MKVGISSEEGEVPAFLFENIEKIFYETLLTHMKLYDIMQCVRQKCLIQYKVQSNKE
jgi:hypothetical protein